MQPFYKITLLNDDKKPFFGPGPYQLLRSLERLGSLSAAARELQMSYSKAIRIVADAEKGLGFALTKRRIGGEGGGSSVLTEEAKEFLARYDRWVQQTKAAGNELFATTVAAEPPHVGCVVLANGRAERFGSQKLLADAAGAPVLERVVAAVTGAGLEPVVATSTPEVEELCRRLDVATVRPAGSDQSDSMKAGLDVYGSTDGCLFVVGDQPALKAESVKAMVDAFNADREKIVRLGYEGRLGNPVLFPKVCYDALVSVEGDRGGSAVIETTDPEDIVVVQAGSAAELVDVDTPEALAGILEEL
jgi:molybdate transport repressor ModE-like protein